MAGDRYFARGKNYFAQGHVNDLAWDGDSFTALVCGTEDYDVELWTEKGQLCASCTCPLGVDGIFCKHCVAVGLAGLANPNPAKSQKKSQKKKRSPQKLTPQKPAPQQPITMDDVQQFLEQQEQSTLVQWILDQAGQDEDWKQFFILKVAALRPQGIDAATFRQALGDAIAIWDFLEWNQVWDYTSKISTVLNSIKDLLEEQPEMVLELCEYGLSQIEIAMNSLDDSMGNMGMLIDDFQNLHVKACKLAHPDPVALADRLLTAEIESGYGIFSDAVTTYAPILGKVGIARYRQRAEEMWNETLAPTPAEPETRALRGRRRPQSATGVPDYRRDYRRRQLQRILESLAKLEGDLEALVEVKRQDLSNPHNYLAIAQLYLDDGQRDRALEWAEAGLKAFRFPNPSLQNLVMEEYHRLGRHEEAMEMVWQSFTQSISLHSYRTLKDHAEQTHQWEVWRDRALTHIRPLLEPLPPPAAPDKTRSISRLRGRQGTSWNSSRQGDGHSILVEIFLWEGEDELAWQEAQAGSCSDTLWLQLAERRQKTHPTDVLPIFQREIERLIQETNNASYAKAITLLKTVHTLRVRLKQQHEFSAFVEHLRQTYKGKRNFIALLGK